MPTLVEPLQKIVAGGAWIKAIEFHRILVVARDMGDVKGQCVMRGEVKARQALYEQTRKGRAAWIAHLEHLTPLGVADELPIDAWAALTVIVEADVPTDGLVKCANAAIP